MVKGTPKHFRGIRWEPSDEQEVVMLFGRLLDYLPRPLAIEYVGTTFPDCKATDSETGEEIYIEFELYSSDFYRDHSKRQERCDWIICWHNDLENKPLPKSCQPKPPKIVSLKKEIDRVHLVLNIGNSAFWDRIGAMLPRYGEITRRLLDFANKSDLQVERPSTHAECLTVRDAEIEYFKIGCHGKIAFPFSRWKGRVPPEVTSAICKRLDEALEMKWFNAHGKGGRDMLALMPDDAAVERFIRVWRDFALTRQPATCRRRRTQVRLRRPGTSRGRDDLSEKENSLRA